MINKPNKQTRQRKLSAYGEQLQEKQKTRNAYGLREAQFRRYFNQAAKLRGQTGTMLLQTLERRLDNVIFRAGLAKTRAQARQMVNHRHFSLNGQRVGIPSILVKVGDVIEPYRDLTVELSENLQEISWLKLDKSGRRITIKELPQTVDLPIEFDTQKIIEFYSR